MTASKWLLSTYQLGGNEGSNLMYDNNPTPEAWQHNLDQFAGLILAIPFLVLLAIVIVMVLRAWAKGR